MRKTIEYYLNLPQIKQGTDVWHTVRSKTITATNIASILEANNHMSKFELFKEKRSSKPVPTRQHRNTPQSIPLEENPTLWGQTFESVAKNLSEYRHKNKIYDLGLKFHEKYEWLGASPDGIGYISRINRKKKQKKIALFEFKCPLWRNISRQIPFEYWTQMQTQMEVWDIDMCVYSEHKFKKVSNLDEYHKSDKLKGILNNEIYWIEDDYWDQVVLRDKEWFKKVFPLISDFNLELQKDIDNDQNQDRTQHIIDYKTVDWDKYHHTLDITNWILEDPIIDWLNKYRDQHNYQEDTKNPFMLQNFVLGKYHEFRTHIFNYIKQFFPDSYIDISEDTAILPKTKTVDYQLHIKYNSKSTRNISRTRTAIEQNIPIILNPLVINPVEKTYGRIDLLIKEDFLNIIFNKDLVDKDHWMPLPNLLIEVKPDCFIIDLDKKFNQSRKKNNNHKHHKHEELGRPGDKRKREDESKSIPNYVMVQIKYSNLNLSANGLHLLNNTKQKVYKGHSTLLNSALGYTLGKEPERSYILGRKSSFSCKHQKYQTDSFLNSLGKIDYSDRDKDYIGIYTDSLKWLDTLHKDGVKWDISKLYPNMNNHRDFPWHSAKKNISDQSGELTVLLNLGHKKRAKLHESGIYSWKQLTPELIEEFKLQQSEVIQNIITSNLENKLINIDDIDHPILENPADIEFYIDFETVSDLQDDFTQLPWTNGNSMIYMVGCFVKNRITGESYYYNYLVDRLKPECEGKMICDWIQDTINILDKYNSKNNIKYNNIHMFHWSQAENTQLNKAIEEHAIDLTVNYNINLIDLYQLFRDAKVGIPGTFRYGLKDVSKALFKLDKMKTVWLDNLDGSQAMVAAWKADNIAAQQNKTISEIDFMRPIIKYNFVDCKTLEEIVEFIRRYKETEASYKIT